MVNHIFSELDAHHRALGIHYKRMKTMKGQIFGLALIAAVTLLADHIRDEEIEKLKEEVKELKQQKEE